MRMQVAFAGFVLAALGSVPALAALQDGTLAMPETTPKSYVLYVAEDHDVRAGKRTIVELRFRVANGFHVNSHMPKSELLIPTALTLEPSPGVTEEAAEYPAGKSYTFTFDPSNKLDVYTGDFMVKVPMVASAGAHTIHGTLHYQACDRAACYPPKNLALQVIFTAR